MGMIRLRAAAPVAERRSSDPGPADQVMSADEFAARYDEHHVAVFRFAARRLGPETAEDVVAEAFTIAWARIASFDPARGEFVSWLFGIVTNVISRHHRQETRQWRAFSKVGVHGTDSFDEELANRLDADVRWPHVASLLAEMSGQDRDVLLLHVWQEMTYQQVADTLGIPVGTVRSRIARARGRLAAASAPVVERTGSGRGR
jgi:RNA polymerase sigma-70 factor (ECF subfamily)